MKENTLSDLNRNGSYPSMEMWQSLVLGVIKQGLDCNIAHLHEFTNQHNQTILGSFRCLW